MSMEGGIGEQRIVVRRLLRRQLDLTIHQIGPNPNEITRC